jgi:hypothetical protein
MSVNHVAEVVSSGNADDRDVAGRKQMEVTCPYSQDEIAVLRRFREICEEITTCRFIRDLPKQKHTFSIENLPDGTSRSTYPQYDKDDFLAFLTHFRKLVANKERTNIFVVLRIIGKHASEEERVALKDIKSLLVSEAKTPPLQLAIGTPGSETAYTPHQIENIIFNAQVFHTDAELQGDLRKLLDFDPFTKMAFLRYATILVKQAWQISCVLKTRGHV